MLQWSLIRTTGFNCHDVVAFILMLQRDEWQRHIFCDRTFETVAIRQMNTHRAAIQLIYPFAKLSPKFLWKFRYHDHRVRPRAVDLRLMLLRFNNNVLGERRRSWPPLLRGPTFCE